MTMVNSGLKGLNSTIMASFLPVIMSKKNKKTKKNMHAFYLLQFLTNSHKYGKNTQKNQNYFLSRDVPNKPITQILEFYHLSKGPTFEIFNIICGIFTDTVSPAYSATPCIKRVTIWGLGWPEKCLPLCIIRPQILDVGSVPGHLCEVR